MESIRRSRSKAELRQGSLHTCSHGLQTSISALHRCSRVRFSGRQRRSERRALVIRLKTWGKEPSGSDFVAGLTVWV
ncbi:hypothetical protein ACFX2F_026959 [Malus domestica]